MIKTSPRAFLAFLACLLTLPLSCTLALTVQAQDPTQPILDEEAERIAENRRTQEQVDELHGDALDLLSQYQAKLKIVDGLAVYNALLNDQLDSQDAEIETLRASIANAAVIERQMIPLMTRMLEGLTQFIALDVPFLLEERKERVANLEALLKRADLTVAEKTRRIFEAYQIENDYGRTLEAYKGRVDLGERSFDVDFLRIGRVALLYRSVGNDRFGYWDKAAKGWVETDQSGFKRNVSKGLSVARQEVAPELFAIPVPPAEAVDS